MAKIIEKSIHGKYEITLIQDESVWVRLNNPNESDFLYFWEAKQIKEAKSIKTGILTRLFDMPESEAILFFPKNAEFWGGGIPKPLKDFEIA